MSDTGTVAPNMAAGKRYSTQVSRRVLIIFAALGLLLMSFLWDVAHGPGNYPLSTVIETLLDKTAHGIKLEVIIWDYRLRRWLLRPFLLVRCWPWRVRKCKRS